MTITLAIISASLCAACLMIGPHAKNPKIYTAALACGTIAAGALIWRMV